MTKKQVAAGLTVAALAAAAIAATWKYRQGHKLTDEEQAQLLELDNRLAEGRRDPASRVGKLFAGLQRRGRAGVELLSERLRLLVAGQLDPDQVIHLEDELTEVEGEADRDQL